MKKNVHLFVFVLIVCAQNGLAQLKTYEQPCLGNICLEASKHYSVELKQDEEEWIPSFSYYSVGHSGDRNASPEPNKSNSWTTFSFEGEVKVKVKLLTGKVNEVVIRPKSKNIKAKVTENEIEFGITEPGQYIVEINGVHLHAMCIFANPLEKYVPTKSSPTLHYFGPGIHLIDIFYGEHLRTDSLNRPINEGDTVYIAGGAWLSGTISASKNIDQTINNVTIMGRGIISGREYTRLAYPDFEKYSYKYGLLRGGSNCKIEGVSIIDATGYSNTFGDNCHMDNIKCLAWYHSTDAYAVGMNSVTENSFSKVMDDHTKARGNNQLIQNNTYFMQRNGSAVIFSYNAFNNVSDFVMRNCDILHADDTWTHPVFKAKHGGGAVLSGLYFEDIRVEGNCNSLFGLALRNNAWVSHQERLYGKMINIKFKNISVEGKVKDANWLWGRTPRDYIDNVTFEDISINGKTVSNVEESDFSIGPFVRNIKFIVNGTETSKEQSLTYQANTVKTLLPADDSPVHESDPDQNYGYWYTPGLSEFHLWESFIVTKRSDGKSGEGFIKFEGIPDSSLWDKAYLILFGLKEPSNTITDYLEKVNEDDWSERTITWNNSRAFTIDGDPVEFRYRAGMNKIDLTSMLKNETDGTISLKLTSKFFNMESRYYTSDATTPFMVFQKNPATEISSSYNSEEIKIYPNPANDSFKLKMAQEGEYQTTLADISGREVLSCKFRGAIGQISTLEINRGVYYLITRDLTRKTIYNKKIVLI